MLNLIMNYLINMFLPGRCSQREPKLNCFVWSRANASTKSSLPRFLVKLWPKWRSARFPHNPNINYAYIYCLKKTKDRTKLSLWDFSYYFQIFWFFSKCFLKPPKFGAFCTKIGTFWNKFRSIFAFLNLTLKMTSKIVINDVKYNK